MTTRDLAGSSFSTAAPASAVRPAGARISRLVKSGVGLGIVSSVLVAIWILVPLGGAAYYTTPLSIRGYSAMHRLLRPSGPVGQTLGVVGGVLMLMPFLYMLRKRIPGLRSLGSLKTWLEIHLFCGIFGPVLVTFHTSFKFNGIVSAAYWSMVIVVLSGFVGRYLYVRIPRSIRGAELPRAELDGRAETMREELERTAGSEAVFARLQAFERAAVPHSSAELSVVDLLFGEITLGRRVHALDRQLATSGLRLPLRADVVALAVERAVLLRRIAYLEWTRKLFELWHVFHLPLVYLQLVIVAAHVAVAVYLGYVPFRW
jgi:hypothetical protein